MNVCEQLGEFEYSYRTNVSSLPYHGSGMQGEGNYSVRQDLLWRQQKPCGSLADICQPDRAVLLIKADSSTMEGMEFQPGIPAIPETCQGSLTGHGICLAAGTPRDLLIWDLSITITWCGATEEEEEEGEGGWVRGSDFHCQENTAPAAVLQPRSCCE